MLSLRKIVGALLPSAKDIDNKFERIEEKHESIACRQDALYSLIVGMREDPPPMPTIRGEENGPRSGNGRTNGVTR